MSTPTLPVHNYCVMMTADVRALLRYRDRRRCATVSTETNTALGAFANSPLLLFGVMGAPPHQFNVNSVFSFLPVHGNLPIHGGENVSSISTGEVGKDEQQAGTAVRAAALARRGERFWWHTSICSPLHFSKRHLLLFRNSFAVFTRNSSEHRAI